MDARQLGGQTDRHMDSQRDTIVPRHYHVVGYKNDHLW